MIEIEVAEMLVHPDEGGLRSVGGGLAVPDHPQRHIEEDPFVTPDQEFESRLVARLAAGHERGVFCIL